MSPLALACANAHIHHLRAMFLYSFMKVWWLDVADGGVWVSFSPATRVSFSPATWCAPARVVLALIVPWCVLELRSPLITSTSAAQLMCALRFKSCSLCIRVCTRQPSASHVRVTSPFNAVRFAARAQRGIWSTFGLYWCVQRRRHRLIAAAAASSAARDGRRSAHLRVGALGNSGCAHQGWRGIPQLQG